MNGIDEELGFGEKKEEPQDQQQKVVNIEDATKRKPFHYWKVGGEEIRLKLKASMIIRVEDKLGKNIMGILTDADSGVPKLSDMLTVIQAAAAPWEHKLSFTRVQELYDKWVDEDDGDQMKFMSQIFMPTLVVSGFFTKKQGTEVLQAMEEVADE